MIRRYINVREEIFCNKTLDCVFLFMFTSAKSELRNLTLSCVGGSSVLRYVAAAAAVVQREPVYPGLRGQGGLVKPWSCYYGAENSIYLGCHVLRIQSFCYSSIA